MKDWIHVILSWVVFFLSLLVKLVSDYSSFITGMAGLFAISFTIWQWSKAAKKEKRKKHI